MIRVVRLGTARLPNEGLRLGTVRRYRAEMKRPEAQRLIALLAALSAHANFSVGCYCETESRCHRSLLRALLAAAGATVS